MKITNSVMYPIIISIIVILLVGGLMTIAIFKIKKRLSDTNLSKTIVTSFIYGVWFIALMIGAYIYASYIVLPTAYVTLNDKTKVYRYAKYYDEQNRVLVCKNNMTIKISNDATVELKG